MLAVTLVVSLIAARRPDRLTILRRPGGAGHRLLRGPDASPRALRLPGIRAGDHPRRDRLAVAARLRRPDGDRLPQHVRGPDQPVLQQPRDQRLAGDRADDPRRVGRDVPRRGQRRHLPVGARASSAERAGAADRGAGRGTGAGGCRGVGGRRRTKGRSRTSAAGRARGMVGARRRRRLRQVRREWSAHRLPPRSPSPRRLWQPPRSTRREPRPRPRGRCRRPRWRPGRRAPRSTRSASSAGSRRASTRLRSARTAAPRSATRAADGSTGSTCSWSCC